MMNLDLYWASKDEWCYRKENLALVVRPDAPKEAQDSYKNYLEQTKGSRAKAK